ncbi:MAG: DMT family transporter [Candidatus Ventricola sp.]
MDNRTAQPPLLARPLVVTVLAIACNVLWGSAIPFINLGYRLFAIPAGETASQILFAGCRFFLAGALTIAFASVPRGRLVRPARQNLHMVAVLAMLQTILQYVLFYIGVARTTSVKAAIIQGLGAFVSILIACYVFHSERMNRLKWLGGVLGVTGVVLVNLSGAGLTGGLRLTGEGCLLLSMIASACSAGAIKAFSQREDPVALSGWQFMLGGAVMAAGGLMLGGRLRPTGWGAAAVLLYLAALSAIAYTVWSMLLKVNPVSRIAPYMFLQPIFGVALSLLLYPGEPAPLVRYGAALCLVCASIVIISHAQREDA